MKALTNSDNSLADDLRRRTTAPLVLSAKLQAATATPPVNCELSRQCADKLILQPICPANLKRAAQTVIRLLVLISTLGMVCLGCMLERLASQAAEQHINAINKLLDE